MSYAVISLINRIISWCSESNLHHFITKCNKGKTLKQLNDLQPSRLWRLQEIRLNRFSLSQLQTTNKLVQALSFPLTNSLFNKQQMQQRKDSKKQPKSSATSLSSRLQETRLLKISSTLTNCSHTWSLPTQVTSKNPQKPQLIPNQNLETKTKSVLKNQIV